MGNDPSVQSTESKPTLLHEPNTTATIELDVTWRGDNLVIGGKDYALIRSLYQEGNKLRESFCLKMGNRPIIELTWQVFGATRTKPLIVGSPWRYCLNVIFRSNGSGSGIPSGCLESVHGGSEILTSLALGFGPTQASMDVQLFGRWQRLIEEPKIQWNETEMLITMK